MSEPDWNQKTIADLLMRVKTLEGESEGHKALLDACIQQLEWLERELEALG